MATITLMDEVNCRITGLPTSVKMEMQKAVRLFDPTAKYTPQGRLGRWNGNVDFMSGGGDTYINLLYKLLPIMEKRNVPIEVEDQRILNDFVFEPINEDFFSYVEFPEGHTMEGKSIKLREHQINAVNALLEHPHGILQACTGAGKAQPLYEPVLTVCGFKPMGEITVGTKVITPRGNVANVTSIHPQGKIMTYKLLLEDGRSTICCGDHLWTVIVNGNKLTIDTNTISKMIEYGINVELPLVCGDNVHSHTKQDPFYTFSTGNVVDFGASYNERMKDIQKLLNGKRIYSPESQEEKEKFQELLYSCGVWNRDVCGVFYEYPAPVLVDLNKKTVRITNITGNKREECQCIYIDDDDHLYVTRDFIVTHNTLITAALSKCVEQYGRSIVIVPSVDLVQQTADDYKMVGLDVGMFSGDYREFNHQHTITTWQSLNSLWKNTLKDKVPMSEQDVYDFINGVVCVMVDECHTAKAEALQGVLGDVMKNIPLRWGLTGTMPKDDIGYWKITNMVGNVVFSVTAKELQDKGYLATCSITAVELKSKEKFEDYHEEKEWLMGDEERIEFIAKFIDSVSKSGNTLILVDTVKTGKKLCDILGLDQKESFIYGNVKKADREKSYKSIRWVDNKPLIATYGVASTGISISRIYNVVLIEAGKSFIRAIQSIGRGLRVAEDKNHVDIYDIYGSSKFSKKHFKNRTEYYKEVSYPYEVVVVKDWR